MKIVYLKNAKKKEITRESLISKSYKEFNITGFPTESLFL